MSQHIDPPSLQEDLDSLNSKLMSQDASAWDVYPGETGQRLYKYEGANTTTYNLPWQHCVVVVEWCSATRGIAVAYRWDNGATRVNMWVNQLHGTWQGWTSIYKTINVSSSVTIASTKGMISQKTAYRTGNIVCLGFVLTTNTAVAADGSFGITATFTDSAMKPVMRQPGSSNNRLISGININPTTSGADLNAIASTSISSGGTFWLLFTYVCVS